MNIKRMNKSLSQFMLLSLSNYLLIILTFIISVFMTHALTVNAFGEYRYILSIIALLVTIFNLGIHYSASRLIAIQENKSDEKKIVHSTIAIMILIYIVVILLVGIYVVLMKSTDQTVNNSFLWAGFLMFTLFFQRILTTIMKGNNKIGDIIIQNTIPQLIILSSYIFIFIYIEKVTLIVALNIFLAAYLITHTLTFIRLRISLKNSFSRTDIKKIWEENKTNGFQIYKGSLASVSINDFLTVIVGGIISKNMFGFFSLAVSMTAPISTIPRVMGIINFKKNSRRNKIPLNNIIFTFVTSIIGALVVNIGVQSLFPIIYDDSYTPALEFLFILSVTALIHGFGDYFNQFLSSHGLGNELKKASYYSGGILLILSIILVPTFNIHGFIYARLVSSTVYFVGMLHSYRIYIK